MTQSPDYDADPIPPIGPLTRDQIDRISLAASAPRPPENDRALAEAIAEISRQGQEIVRLRGVSKKLEEWAFVAGWFAHARNPERLVVEDAWRAYRSADESGIPSGEGAR